MTPPLSASVTAALQSLSIVVARHHRCVARPTGAKTGAAAMITGRRCRKFIP